MKNERKIRKTFTLYVGNDGEETCARDAYVASCPFLTLLVFGTKERCSYDGKEIFRRGHGGTGYTTPSATCFLRRKGK